MNKLQNIFFQDIMADPWDDGIRLIYADYLEERGNPLGRFIRVQVELSLMEAWNIRAADLVTEEKEILKRHSQEWSAHIPSIWKRFHRGFVSGIRISNEKEMEILDKTPVDGVRLMPENDVLKALVLHPRWKFVREVNCWFCCGKLNQIRRLLEGKIKIRLPAKESFRVRDPEYWTTGETLNFLKKLSKTGLKKVCLRDVTCGSRRELVSHGDFIKAGHGSEVKELSSMWEVLDHFS